MLLVIGGEEEKKARTPEGDEYMMVARGEGSLAAPWSLSSLHPVLPVFANDLNTVLDKTPEEIAKGPFVILFERLPSINKPVSLYEGLVYYGLVPSASFAGSFEIVAPTGIDAAVSEVRKRHPVPRK